MLPTILLLCFIIVLLLAAFFYSKYRMKKALREVIKIFRVKKALDKDSAKTREELGLVPPSLLTRMMSQRDYKPYALQLMLGVGIIQTTPDDKYYLSETTLASSKLNEFVK